MFNATHQRLSSASLGQPSTHSEAVRNGTETICSRHLQQLVLSEKWPVVTAFSLTFIVHDAVESQHKSANATAEGTKSPATTPVPLIRKGTSKNL